MDSSLYGRQFVPPAENPFSDKPNELSHTQVDLHGVVPMCHLGYRHQTIPKA